MPRYFFDTPNCSDDVGAELPDEESAHEHALGLAESFLDSGAPEAEAGSMISIRDQQGEVVATLKSVQF